MALGGNITKWKIKVEAGRYIHSHEKVQRIRIQHRLNNFMQVHGAELVATLVTELKNMDRWQ